MNAKPTGVLRSLHRLHAIQRTRRRGALCALALLAVALTAGVAALAQLSSGPAQAQGAEPPPPSNLQCITRTDVVWFMWDVPEWAGEEAVSYDYELALPDGRREQGNVKGQTLLRWGSYPSEKPVSLSVKANYETAEGRQATSAQATLTCSIGGARVLAIKAGNTTRKYGGTDALSHTVSGLVDGDAAADVVSGRLGRTPGDDAGSYSINMGTLAIRPAYATKYALPTGPTVATYIITPKAAAYTASGVNKRYDGTTAVAGILGGRFAAGDIVPGDTVTVTGGTYASADVGTGLAITGTSVGGADAGNYAVTISVSGDITPLEITTISGVRVNSRLADGTTAVTFDTGSAQGTGVLPAELADLRAGGLAVSGAFPSAAAGSYDVKVTYSLQDQGVFKAGNYTLSVGVATATLQGEIRDEQAQLPTPTSTPTPATAAGNLQATVIADGVRLTWDAPADQTRVVTGYEVLRRESGQPGMGSYLLDTGSTDTSYTDRGAAKQGETYTYQVKARADGWSAEASNSASVTIPGTCPISGGRPVDVAISKVPIVLASTTADYFVLYVRPDLDADLEIPVSVTLGQDGTTTLTEQLAALPEAHYRVEKYRVANPGDVDADCIDDITELRDLGTKNPVNKAEAVDIRDGAVAIPDRATFERLSYQGEDVPWDVHLADLEFVKFYIFNTARPMIYFMNTTTHRTHSPFLNQLYMAQLRRDRGVLRPENIWFLAKSAMRGVIVYHPNAVAPDGSLGVYRFEFQPKDAYSFERVAYANEALAASMPLLDNNLAYYPVYESALPLYYREKALYDASRVNVLLEEDILPDVDFIPLNEGEGYGFLRAAPDDERPNPRDVVIYETLPNDLPRVAGIITTVPQTPLSHVNLRAVQDDVPNAFIRDALDDSDIDDLIGRHVHYEVTRSGYTLRAATRAEVDAHYESSRPAKTQTPERDLSVTKITALSSVGFDDWDAFGVKAANVAVLGTLDFPEGTVPDGFAVPFYFYDEFMKNAVLAEETLFGKKKWDDDDKFTLPAGAKLSAAVTAMLAHPKFQTDYEIQEEMLDDLRDAIKDAESPQWITQALTTMHATYPEGQSLRYRSSTNNEDLPGFSGAGLYDSKTQDPDETAEDGIDKSIKGVWASLWNFRAFVERDFHRIDHTRTAMGVLVHPNYSDEPVNGVAVSFDPFSGREGAYYVNTQVGEDLVTNPEAHSAPEEILLLPDGSYDVLAYSNQKEPRGLLMSDAQMSQLRRHLAAIHDRFKALYRPAPGEPFAMEIEFKITSANILAIKQARPWVFAGRGSSTGDTPVVDQPLADVSGLEAGSSHEVSLSGVFSDADGEALTVTASSSNNAVATVSVSDNHSALTVSGVTEGTATITVTAQDSDGNRVSDAFDVSVARKYAALIAQMYEWRNDPQWVGYQAHTDRWDRALLAFGETVVDTTLTPMTAAEARDFADRGWSRWVEVAAALKEIEAAPQQQQGTPNRAPTVASAIADATIVNQSGTKEVSLSGVFSDADNDALTVTAVSSDEAKATVSVAADYSTLTVSAKSRGMATITVTAADGRGGTVEDTFTVTVKTAPVVASALADVSGLEVDATREVSLSGAFSDADGDALTITATSSDETVATVSVASDGSRLTLAGVSVGTATITVTARDADGNGVSDTFDAPVARKYAALIAQMYQWRNDPQWSSYKAHTDRWDRVLLAFGETVADTTLTPMTADEAQGFADRGNAWSRWVEVAKALKEIEATGQQQQPNQAPTVAAALGDVTIVNQSATHTASLSGVFSDADGDSLTVTAASSNEAVATVSVSSDHSGLTVSAQARGTATITVNADDGNGGTADDAFTVTVKAEPVVASAISDISSLETGNSQDVSLSGVFSDADGDSLTITAGSSDSARATATVASDRSKLTVAGVAGGVATITVTAQDADGNRVSDEFEVSVVPAPESEQPNRAPTVASPIAGATIANESATYTVSLSGVFTDADGDALTITASSSTDAVATVSVDADYSTLTVSARSRGTATITVTAKDGNGGTVADTFTVKVKSAPVVDLPLTDISGLEVGATQDVSLSGTFSDADGDNLTITAASSDDAKATVTVAADQSTLTVTGVAEGTATITVTAQDADGNRVSDNFTVSVEPEPEEEEPERETSDGSPTVAQPIADISLEPPQHGAISLSGVFHDPDGDELTFSATSSNYGVASMWITGSTLTVVATGTGTATITVTAEDPDGNEVSDAFQVTVTPAS